MAVHCIYIYTIFTHFVLCNWVSLFTKPKSSVYMMRTCKMQSVPILVHLSFTPLKLSVSVPHFPIKWKRLQRFVPWCICNTSHFRKLAFDVICLVQWTFNTNASLSHTCIRAYARHKCTMHMDITTASALIHAERRSKWRRFHNLKKMHCVCICIESGFVLIFF